MKISRKYGWYPGKPDPFCLRYSSIRSASILPSVVDLRNFCPAVYDQGDLGACTANALGGLVQVLQKKANRKVFTPSRLFVYYNSRVLENLVSEDSGASLTDTMNVATNLGSPNEAVWWYNIVKYKVKPNLRVYADGLNCRISDPLLLDNTNLYELKSCLVEGYPFVFGFTAYDSFESYDVSVSGMVPMPKQHEGVLGGHAMCAVGYDDSKQAFLVRNSWGANWGLGGYCYMPYAYLTDGNLAGDFWTAHSLR
jgi:C1A family cysteine protease